MHLDHSTDGVDPSVVDALSAGVASALRSAIPSGASTTSNDIPSVVSGLLGGLGVGNSGSGAQNVLQNLGALFGLGH